MSSNGNARHVKVLILGSGPAGLSAALYAARAELAPVVLSGIQLGGQAALTYAVENYPGFPEGVGGAQLGELFQKQAEHFGATVEFETANEVDPLSAAFQGDRRQCQVSGRHAHHRHRRQFQSVGSSGRKRADRPRRIVLRYLRRMVLQGQEGDRGRRGRQRGGGRPVCHALCVLRDDRAPARRTTAPVRCFKSVRPSTRRWTSFGTRL